jgi:hypothetical protein
MNPIVKIINAGVPTATATAIICLIFIYTVIYELALNTLHPQPSTHHVSHSTGHAWIDLYYGQIFDPT